MPTRMLEARQLIQALMVDQDVDDKTIDEALLRHGGDADAAANDLLSAGQPAHHGSKEPNSGTQTAPQPGDISMERELELGAREGKRARDGSHGPSQIRKREGPMDAFVHGYSHSSSSSARPPPTFCSHPSGISIEQLPEMHNMAFHNPQAEGSGKSTVMEALIYQLGALTTAVQNMPGHIASAVPGAVRLYDSEPHSAQPTSVHFTLNANSCCVLYVVQV